VDGQRVEYLERVVVEQAALIEALTKQNAMFEARIAVLEAEVAASRKNSSNSSKPPSRDGNEQREQAKQSRAQRRAEARKAGKQPGAPGRHLQRRGEPDETVVHRPDTCAGCGHGLGHADVVGSTARQVFDLPKIDVLVTEHVACRVRCSCGHETTAPFPIEATAPTCWGPNVRALAVYLTVRQHLPVARAAEVMSEMLGASVSTGFIVACQADAAGRLVGFIAYLKHRLAGAAVVHADETSTRVSSAAWWMHVVSTNLLTLLVAHRRRGREAITDIDVLPTFRGVLVRDGLAVYDDLTTSTHAQCGAHLLRHLTAVGETRKYAAWTEAMTTVLIDAKNAAVEAAAKGMSQVPARQAAKLRARYRAVLVDAFALLPPGRPPRRRDTGGWRTVEREAYNLAARFRDHEPDILRFLADTRVPFTNNQAERDLRMTKLHDKISGTFRNPDAARDFATTRSYVQTAAKHGHSPLDALRQLFTSGAWLPAPT
jgi:transposase